MDKDDMTYDIAVRLEEKLDRHIAQTSDKVGRVELVAWLTILGGLIVGLG